MERLDSRTIDEVIDLAENDLALPVTDRDREIIRIADEMLARLAKDPKTLDSASIDAAFILRFDPYLYPLLKTLRRTMRTVVGLEGDEPLPSHWDKWSDDLSEEEFEALYLLDDVGDEFKTFLGFNHGLDVFPLDEERRHWKLSTDMGYYLPWQKSLRGRQWKTVPLIPTKISEEDLMIMSEVFYILRILKGIREISYEFDLIPAEHSPDRRSYSDLELKAREREITSWVVTDTPTPSFRFDVLRLRSVRSLKLPTTNQEVGYEMIRPVSARCGVYTDEEREEFERQLAMYETGKKPMSGRVRVRTWSIYYLTKRGGGSMSWQGAIDFWNECFDIRFANIRTNTTKGSFGNQLNRLFSLLSVKKTRGAHW